MSLSGSQLLFSGDTGVVDSYKIQNSARFAATQSGSAEKTPASSSSTTTWTFATWVKRASLNNSINLFGAKTGSNYTSLYFSPTNFGIKNVPVGGASTNGQASTNMQFNDPSAWYHLVVVWDTTNATSTDRIRIYVNGVRADVNLISTPSLNTASVINTNQKHELGKELGVYAYNDLYLAHIYFIDGQALSESSFGFFHSVTKSWRPKPYAGTYGTNGFFLNFSDTSSGTTSSNVGIGKDFSGNGNYWITNLSVNPSDIGYAAFTDVPTLTSATAANYPVLNRLVTYRQFADINSGNLVADNNNVNSNFCNVANMAMPPSSGKFYWEVVWTGAVSIGVKSGITDAESITSNSITGYGFSMSTNAGAVIGLTYDCATGVLTAYVNNVSQGTVYTADTTKSWIPSFSNNNTASNVEISVNFGQRPFTYTPPTGFIALNTYNLPTPTIVAGNKYMDATLWTGDDSAQTITNAGAFKPDLVWWKNRNSTRNHLVFDSIRGAGNYIQTNSTAAEATDAQMLTSFNSNGFTHGTSANGSANAETYVGWQWQAGQGSTSSNTNGSITSTVSVNASAGFSIVTYTGTGANATVGHGLGVAPKMVIVKNRNAATEDWRVYHVSIGATNYLNLNGTIASSAASTVWNNTTPTSTVFSIGTNASVSGNTQNIVAYCWAEIAGFSKFGSYTGNGSTDGTFIYLGFRPKFVMIKRYDAGAESWTILDTSVNTYNLTYLQLFPNSTNAEVNGSGRSPSVQFDYLSNGFKLRGANGEVNGSGWSYIYAAFAENPFKNANAR